MVGSKGSSDLVGRIASFGMLAMPKFSREGRYEGMGFFLREWLM